jgi:hypothetical protein
MVLRNFCQALMETLKVFGVALIAATSICAMLSLISTSHAAVHGQQVTPVAATGVHASPAVPTAVPSTPVLLTAELPAPHALPDQTGQRWSAADR